MKFKTIFTTVALAILAGCVILFTSCTGLNAFLESESGQAVMEHGGVIAGVFVGSNNLDKIDEMVKTGPSKTDAAELAEASARV